MIIDADATDGADAIYADSSTGSTEEDADAVMMILALRDLNAAKDLKDLIIAVTSVILIDSEIEISVIATNAETAENSMRLPERILTVSSRKQDSKKVKENAAAENKYKPRSNNELHPVK